MRKTNKKGFTIVELVIVIAVIGILATVLIPTFSGVIGSANLAALKADIKTVYNQYVAEQSSKGEAVDDVVYVLVNGKYYMMEKGTVKLNADGTPAECTVAAEAEHTDACKTTTVDHKCGVCGVVIGGTHQVMQTGDAADAKCSICGQTKAAE